MPAPPSITFDAAGRLAADVFCVKCGHNVRGMPLSANCGECGTPVKWSLGGSLLGAADVGWLRRVRSGVALLTLLMIWVWLPLVWPVVAFGLWRLTTPDPRDRRAQSSILALISRAVLTWGLGLTVAALLIAWGLSPGGPPPAISNWLSEAALASLLWTAYFLVLVIVALHLGRLARRGNSKSLRALAGLAAVAGLIAVTACGIGAVAELTNVKSVDYIPVVGLVAVVAGAALVPAFVWLCMALIVAWRLLHVAEIQARGLRSEVKVWQVPTPGESWRSRAAANASAAAGSADPVEA